ncbi:MAG: GNAT family N-acetyltransferase [Eubacteriales bacterium]|jgi:L-amino acid N-acyltransferase YncA
MNVVIRQATEEDLPDLIRIWNEVVDDGMAFPQTEDLDEKSGEAFFKSMYTAAAVADGKVVGLYILHPNNIGRVGHIANASYAIDRYIRGQHIGEKLVRDSLIQARKAGYRIMQFNAVVASNIHAYDLYIREGFTDLGIIPGGFLDKQGKYEDIHVMYNVLS